MRKIIYYYLEGGGYLNMDCPGTCDDCQIRFRCYTEGKNIDSGKRTDSIVIEDREEFMNLAKLWRKDWLVKAGKGLVDVSRILY